jgi:hypothetical protein
VAVAGAPAGVSVSERGYARPRPNRSYTIKVKTSNVANAGTDECVWAAFQGEYWSGYKKFDGPEDDL